MKLKIGNEVKEVGRFRMRVIRISNRSGPQFLAVAFWLSLLACSLLLASLIETMRIQSETISNLSPRHGIETTKRLTNGSNESSVVSGKGVAGDSDLHHRP